MVGSCVSSLSIGVRRSLRVHLRAQRSADGLQHRFDQVWRAHQLDERHRRTLAAAWQPIAEHREVASRRDDQRRTQGREELQRGARAVARHHRELALEQERFPEQQVLGFARHQKHERTVSRLIARPPATAWMGAPVTATPPVSFHRSYALSLSANEWRAELRERRPALSRYIRSSPAARSSSKVLPSSGKRAAPALIDSETRTPGRGSNGNAATALCRSATRRPSCSGGPAHSTTKNSSPARRPRRARSRAVAFSTLPATRSGRSPASWP